MFRQESCVGCGQCVDVCPERCLHLTKVLEVSKLNHEPQMIFEGEFARCRVCGDPFAPKAMVESVRARLGTTGEAALRLETCPKCRMKGRSAHEERRGNREMDQFLRVVAVFLEVSVLGVMIFCLVWGLKLLLEDLGLNKKYDKVIVMALSVVCFIIVIFFTIHLSSFYPAYSGA